MYLNLYFKILLDQNNGFFVKMSLIENNNLAESKMLAHEKIERSIIGFNNYYNGI